MRPSAIDGADSKMWEQFQLQRRAPVEESRTCSVFPPPTTTSPFE
jgi:hypothetical protein